MNLAGLKMTLPTVKIAFYKRVPTPTDIASYVKEDSIQLSIIHYHLENNTYNYD